MMMMNDKEIIDYAIKNYCYHICSVKRCQCRRENLDFDLDEQWYVDRLMKGCELTGIPFVWAREGHSLYNPSVDRVDPTKGYTKDNCKLILRGINMLKLNGTMEDVYKIAAAIIDKKE